MLASATRKTSPLTLASTGQFLFFAGIIVAPWLHGLELVWEQLLFCALLAATTITLAAEHQRVLQLPAPVWRLFALWMLWACISLIYLAPFPADVLATISPLSAEHYEGSAGVAEGYLTVYHYASAVESIKLATLGALILIVCALFNNKATLHKLVLAIVFSVGLTAVYSLLNYIFEGELEVVSAIPPWDYPWSEGMRGTFSYKNQYALLVAMTIALAAGWLLDKLLPVKPSAHNTGASSGKIWAIAVAALLVLFIIVLLNTGSRGALAALGLSGLLCAIPLLSRATSSWRKWLNIKTIAGGIAVFAVVSVLFMQSSAFQRFTSDGLQGNGRTHLRNTALTVFEHYPVAGSGPGTYPYIQHQYKPSQLGNSAMSKRAHNDYLETLATTGLTGTFFIALAMAYLLFLAFRPTKQPTSGLLMGCRAAMLCYLIQAAIDVTISAFLLPVMFIVVGCMAVRENG